MPTLAPELNTPAPDVLADIRGQLQVLNGEQEDTTALFHEQCKIEPVSDSDGWDRSVVHIEGLDFPVTFRGKNELPNLIGQEKDVEVSSLTPVYASPHTEILTTDELRGWNAERGNSQLPEVNTRTSEVLERSLEAAMEAGSEVMVSVDATPLGICQLLRAVHDIYPADFFSDDVAELLTYVEENKIDTNPAAQNLLVDMLAAGHTGGSPAEDALALVVASRIGKAKARQVAVEALGLRREILDLDVQYGYMTDRGFDTLQDVEEAGSYDTKEMMEQTKGLVWVHRNKTHLQPNEPIMPLSKFHSQSARSTVHGTLNHVVENPHGNHGESVDGLGSTTVIAPVASMIEANDKPTSLYGVDTYWDSDKGVTIPQDAILLHVGRSGVNSEHEISIPSDLTKETAGQFIEDLLNQHDWLAKGTAEAYKRRLIEDGTTEAMANYYMQSFSDMQQGMLKEELEAMPDGSDYTEKVHDMISGMVIRTLGGNSVQPDGMSAYIETAGFDNQVMEIAKKSGVLTGTHDNHPTSPYGGTEAAFQTMLAKVFEHDVVDGQKVVRTKAHPEKLDSSELWKQVSSSPEKALEWLMSGWLSYEQNSVNKARVPVLNDPEGD